MEDDLEIAYKPVSGLHGYERNARTHSEEQVSQIADSIQEFGFTNPLLIDENGTIIAGHGRLEAALHLGMEYVPCIVLGHLTEDQRRAYVLADNRLALNAGWFCSTERPFQFVGRINEDVNTYTSLAKTGGLFLTIPNIAVQQKQTQQNKGGMTDIYMDSGTYVKSFYTVIFSPSCAVVRTMGQVSKRLHHNITWRNAVPVILEEKFKKNSPTRALQG